MIDELLKALKEKAQELSSKHWGDDERHLIGKGIQCMYVHTENIIRSHMKNNEWIPCSERLPEDGQKVLATHKGGLNPNLQVIEHVFRGGEFLDNWDMDTDFKSPTFGKRYMGDVIAWQTLPAPYEVKSDE